MMRTAAEEGARFIEVFLGPLAQDLATSRSLSPESVKKLDDLLAGKSGQRMILVKIWLPDSTLAYSTNKEFSVGSSLRVTSPQLPKARRPANSTICKTPKMPPRNTCLRHSSKSMRHCSVREPRR